MHADGLRYKDLSSTICIHPCLLLAAAAALSLQVVKGHATPTVPTWTRCQRGTGSAGYAWKTVTASWQGRSLWTLQVYVQLFMRIPTQPAGVHCCYSVAVNFHHSCATRLVPVDPTQLCSQVLSGLQLGGLGESQVPWLLPTSLFPGHGEERRLRVLDPSSVAAQHGESGGVWFAAVTGCSPEGPVVAHSGWTAMLIAF